MVSQWRSRPSAASRPGSAGRGRSSRPTSSGASLSDSRAITSRLSCSPPREEEDFYNRVCNDTLWPLFHYFSDRLRITPEAWERYVEVNERFADVIVGHAEPGSRVWIHDFHLMLVPALLRRRDPSLSIGFFLHTPFPSSEVYRLLPGREQLLRGVLGADYVSFQIGDYARHFRSSVLRILGIDSEPDWLEIDGRRVGIGVDPIGIDTEGFRETLLDPETARLLAELERQYDGRRLVLGVERLDYTKGIPQKLHAFERFLEQDPTRARSTTMIQVLVPSRLESPEYRSQRDEIELLIARINGRFGQPGSTPVEYIHRDISKPALVALYRRADVMMVTALRDGMNLVAHEFVLCQSEPGPPGRWRGALLLSELAGAAQVLPGALLVNPWNVDGVVEQLATALGLSARERQRRLETMAKRVEDLDTRRWAEGFLTRLGRYSHRDRRRKRPPTVDAAIQERIARRFARARARTILLDYDGTLREFEIHPDLAQPTPEIRALLRALAALPEDERPHHQRPPPAEPRAVARASSGSPVRRARLPRACSGRGVADAPRSRPLLAPSDRAAPPPSRGGRPRGARRAEVVQRRLALPAGRARVRIVACPRAPERPAPAPRRCARGGARRSSGRRGPALGVDKGVYVRSLFPDGKESTHFVLGLGDDRTDHDLLDALPQGSIAGHVGGLLPSDRHAQRAA